MLSSFDDRKKVILSKNITSGARCCCQ